METFQKSLKSLTELQEDESKFGQSRDSMDKSLSLFHQAYSLLLEGNMFDEIKTPPIDSISVNAVSLNKINYVLQSVSVRKTEYCIYMFTIIFNHAFVNIFS